MASASNRTFQQNSFHRKAKSDLGLTIVEDAIGAP